MEKHYLEAVSMLEIAAQHAYCAEHLLQQNAEVSFDDHLSVDALLPVTSLIYLAFELTLKAFLLHEHRPVRQHVKLIELIELNDHLGLSKHEMELVTTLCRVQAFRKGVDYMIWENRQQLQVFCEQAMGLYSRLHHVVPLELQQEYQ
ncbi:hypothetical protein [Legionella impletisoli]|uniref:HEPN domain protein n=1 Tax=Legionella impletisoli TaxID=343510 RepID=A0A917NBZ2_9GAMM|nr:hypothetical protein [Legionella impletisoli]GGI86923.1 hypothetical protein GCM10007966_14510 [Legionella impletisoli]